MAPASAMDAATDHLLGLAYTHQEIHSHKATKDLRMQCNDVVMCQSQGWCSGNKDKGSCEPAQISQLYRLADDNCMACYSQHVGFAVGFDMYSAIQERLCSS